MLLLVEGACEHSSNACVEQSVGNMIGCVTQDPLQDATYDRKDVCERRMRDELGRVFPHFAFIMEEKSIATIQHASHSNKVAKVEKARADSVAGLLSTEIEKSKALLNEVTMLRGALAAATNDKSWLQR